MLTRVVLANGLGADKDLVIAERRNHRQQDLFYIALTGDCLGYRIILHLKGD